MVGFCVARGCLSGGISHRREMVSWLWVWPWLGMALFSCRKQSYGQQVESIFDLARVSAVFID